MNFINLGPADTTPFGPSGKDVYERTYSRIRDDGTRETWKQTVERVVLGNLALVDQRYIQKGEQEALIALMEQFAIIPAGRHLWLSGVKGKQFINNCWVSGWTEKASDHFAFTFDQLMQGGGVGANYSGLDYEVNSVTVHLVCDDSHPNYEDLKPYLSKNYASDSSQAVAVEDTREGWVATLVRVLDHAVNPEKDRHGYTAAIVFDLSRIRASGTKIKTFGGTSAGPEPLARLLTNVAKLLNENGLIDGKVAMEIDHAIAECVVSGNVRRSARMSVMHWRDPLIKWFIGCKADMMSHWSTNISVAIDQQFLDALYIEGDMSAADAALAQEIYDLVTEGMYKNGEPGFWNEELSNEDEPNRVEATNPCGEITLPAWGVCNLGHVNLDYFADKPLSALAEAHHLMARFLVRATFADIPSDKARAVQDRDRRIGVGHFGFHGWVAKNGVKFSEAAQTAWIPNTLGMMQDVVRSAAREYAWMLRIPEPVKVTTVAPTGTIAKMPGRSEGIHPIFAPYFKRRIRYSSVDPDQSARLVELEAEGHQVEDDLYSANTKVVTFVSKEPLVDELIAKGYDPDVVLESAYDLTVAEQLSVQAMYQREYADNAVSFTVNFDPQKVALEDLRWELLHYLPLVKGTTVFPVVSRAQSPYEPISKQEYLETAVVVVSDGVDEECSSGACPVK